MVSTGKPVILCVDDEENPLALRKLVLEKAGYEVLTATSAQEGLELAARNDIDLVLSDQLMPGMTGTEFTARVKAAHPTLPVILISGINERPAGADLADVFMSKVEGPDVLCKHIAATLNRRNSPPQPDPAR